MGNITSRQATNLIDGFVLRLARTVDAVLRTINRKLSTVSSYIFSRVFGYDVVFADDTSPTATDLCRKESLVCGPGNVCIVPASRIQQRQLEKKRRSERRKRAEAAALGEELLRKHGYSKVESAPSSPPREVKGKGSTPEPTSPVGDKTIDQQVVKRMQDQRSNLTAESAVIKRRIQPRKSSKHAHKVNTSLATASNTGGAGGRIQPVVEADETIAEVAIDPGHVMPRKEVPKPLHAPQPRVLPPGALSLGPSPWAPAFRHPFSADHEPLPTVKPKPHAQQSRPKLSLDTHLEKFPLPNSSPATFLASPTEHSDPDDTPTTAPFTISRPPSAASFTRSRTPGLARKSIDAISLRSSFDASSSAAAIDVKTLATKAVKEEKGRKVWKDQVNKAAMQRCLLQQHQLPLTAAGAGGAAGRRFSTATLATDKALTRVKTHEERVNQGRRGSSPALNAGFTVGAMTSGKSTPVLWAESPLSR
ncbi:hypothetical protein [Sporisorium scitamineum]|uniref:Uncharacterized protein n=1 Tax=Sporisorium scitamineum TaxID=49012 RepID=A0A0F7RVF2_9BASI|nr:hypothetical protein [Sporisorium scitamineum]